MLQHFSQMQDQGPAGVEACMYAAVETGVVDEFPVEALSKEPLGYWSKWLQSYGLTVTLEKPAAEKGRHFCARVAFDSLCLAKMLIKCAELCDQFDSYEEAAASRNAASGAWSPDAASGAFHPDDGLLDRESFEALRNCLSVKPDSFYLGWVPLSDRDWQVKWRRSNVLFLKHLFQKHHGEAVYVNYKRLNVDWPEMTWRQKEAARQSLFNKQLYVEPAHLEDYENYGRNSVWQETWQWCAAGADGRPAGWHRTCGCARIAYHTLPSMVWCLMSRGHNLLDIYTAYCGEPLLMTKAPHPNKSNRRLQPHLRSSYRGRWPR